MAAPQGSGLRAGPFPVPTWYAETFVGEARSADLRSGSVSPGDRVWALLPSILRVGSTSLSIGELLSIEGETVTVRSLKRGESGQLIPDDYWFQGVPGATVHRASVAVNSGVRQGDVVIACFDPRDGDLCPVNAIVTKAIPDRVDVKFVYEGSVREESVTYLEPLPTKVEPFAYVDCTGVAPHKTFGRPSAQDREVIARAAFHVTAVGDFWIYGDSVRSNKHWCLVLSPKALRRKVGERVRVFGGSEGFYEGTISAEKIPEFVYSVDGPSRYDLPWDRIFSAN